MVISVNLAVLDCHNRFYLELKRSKWDVALSMGPGLCLEGLVVKSLHDEPVTFNQGSILHVSSIIDNGKTTRMKVHIVGAGLAGLALAAGLDPNHFEVKVFESSSIFEEKGYGLAIWPSTLQILKKCLFVYDLDCFSADAMYIRRHGNKERSISLKNKGKDKGFIQRSHLLASLKKKVHERHPRSIFSDHRCSRLRFVTNGRNNSTIGTYEHASRSVNNTCD